MGSRDVPQPFIARRDRDRVDWPRALMLLVVVPLFVLACWTLIAPGLWLAFRWGLFDG